MNSIYLQTLNPAQVKGHDPAIPLQILAGPGSGKTKVLTSRIAHLILQHNLAPSSICAVTFTNKAANEMKERLTKLIGKEKAAELKMGTFHALCALFLRKYSKSIGLEANFTVCDAEESKKIIATLLKKYKADLEAKDIVLKDGTVLSLISKAKARGMSAVDFAKEAKLAAKTSKSGEISSSSISNDIDMVVAEIYQEYEKILKQNNSLDFDDLLLFGLKLFSRNEHAVSWCKHVFVDEFQDTNITQYELMRAIAVARCVTVVGDPDQSIYGWRSAEVGNLKKMQKDFPYVEQIFLEQNYRSTGSILRVSMAIVNQDKSRIQKSLIASHPTGTTPVLRCFSSEQAEATFIAVEIKRIAAHMGGMLRWSDFVILLRFNALSRTIESALQKEGIPSRVLGGHKFFERLEIKDLLAYLQLMDNPHFIPAFTRAVNTPSRGIGEKTLSELLSRSDKSKISPLDLIEKIHDGKTPDIKPPVKRKLQSFVTHIRLLRKLANEGASPAELIRRLVDVIEYQNHLRQTQPDWETRWENVQELVTFASDVHVDAPEALSDGGSRDATPLRLFLQASMLSSEGDHQGEENDKEKVTISTCHSAKGLEWPVVMVPAVEQGTFPFYRSDDIEEERRLLYVACTRAQSLLYISHVNQRKVAGETKGKELSTFISAVTKQNSSFFTDQLASFAPAERAVISRVLDRPVPSDSDVAKNVAEFHQTMKHRETVPSQHHFHDGQPATFARPTAHSRDSPATTTFTGNVAFTRPQATQLSNIAPIPAPLVQLSSSLDKPSQNPVSLRSLATVRTFPAIPSEYGTPSKLTPLQGPTNAFRQVQNTAAAGCSTPSEHSLQTVRPNPTEVAQSLPPTAALVSTAGVKRRLGMGRGTAGYTNKKFKPP
ncbi:ATP-dependent DNA helicase srs2 [Stygiomarasmius scandens]|uniref:DNA 3'-5' helicase n=1 Tax=Marasmiellus scandens TaxID=2682957 RepID=A0ABR1JM83_9AGAR